MLTIRKKNERGHADHGWLDSHHTFSFADYHDPAHMGFRHLRVINEDRVEPGQGFGQHGHRDMEILTWILDGALEHKDSTKSGGVIRPGDIQYMSAGKGVLHSEFNASKTEPVHFLQIWVLPDVASAAPRYEQKNFASALAKGGLVTLASKDGENGSIAIRQNVKLLAARAPKDETYEYPLGAQRYGWLQVARDNVRVNDVDLSAGDGLAIEREPKLTIQAMSGAEFLLFDLA
jgi:quercetin 2,3-dioxygenase